MNNEQKEKQQMGGVTSRNFGADLARSFAILSVYIVHFVATQNLAPGSPGTAAWLSKISVVFGFFGVELFFVLSGFLIGRLVLDIVLKKPDRHELKIFLIRRWMRTLPPYFVWMAVLLVFLPPTHDRLMHIIGYATFTQNFAWPMPASNWFGVSWSLSIEEWFYLGFPIIAILFSARHRGAFYLALVLFMVIPLILRIILASDIENADSGLRKVVIFRLDAIAYGVALATLLRSAGLEKRAYWILGFAVGLMIIIGTTLGMIHGPAELRPWLYTSTPLGLALALPLLLMIQRPSGILLSSINWLSTRSYPIYLVHHSIMLWVLHHQIGDKITYAVGLTLYVLLTIIFSELLHQYVEVPAMKRRPKQFAIHKK